MVLITHHGENLEKTGAILQAARRRFGIYGLAKTSMQEIASDLSMSKGALYYYFPDKEHLYKAVVEQEHNEFINTLILQNEKVNDPVLLLQNYLYARQKHFRTLLNLGRLRIDEIIGMRPIMEEVWSEFHARELGMIREIIEKGIHLGIFQAIDSEAVASLFMDVMKGLRAVVMKTKELYTLDEDEYNLLIAKDALFFSLFINGLKYK
jgi:AcrR family transcriptional regulator